VNTTGLVGSSGRALLERAIAYAVAAHAGQRDKNGEPYILHPLRVMEAGVTYEEKIVGVLHDVVEDCGGWPAFTLDIPLSLRASLDAISKRKRDDGRKELNSAYLRRVKLDPVARAVKINDLRDNMREDRHTRLSVKMRYRMARRYPAALRFLLA